MVAVDAERLELRVALPVAAAPVAPGEVAGVHVQAADLVVEPRRRAEVALDDALLTLLRGERLLLMSIAPCYSIVDYSTVDYSLLD